MKQTAFIFVFFLLSFFIYTASVAQVHIKKNVVLDQQTKSKYDDTLLNLSEKVKQFLPGQESHSLRKENGQASFPVTISLPGKDVFLSEAWFHKAEINSRFQAGTGISDLDITVAVQNDTMNRQFRIDFGLNAPEKVWDVLFIDECGYYTGPDPFNQHYVFLHNEYTYERFDTSYVYNAGRLFYNLGQTNPTDNLSIEMNNHIDEGYQIAWLANIEQNQFIIQDILLFSQIQPEFLAGIVVGQSMVEFPLCVAQGETLSYGIIQKTFYLLFEWSDPNRELDIQPAQKELYTSGQNKIRVTVRDLLGNEVGISAGKQVEISASEGTFAGGNPLTVDYDSANTDSITFIAPDSLPVGIDTLDVLLSAHLTDGSGIVGKTKIEVLKRPEYEITLEIPEPSEIWPTFSPGGNWTGRNVNSNNILQNIQVRLNTNDNPAIDKDVIITASFINNTGGHNHDGAHDNPGLNLLGVFSTIPASQTNNGTITEKTDVNGEILLEYIAPDFCSSIIIEAQFNDEEEVYSASDTLIVRVPNLVEMQESEYYELIGAPDNHSGTNDPCRTVAPISQHDINHYGTQALITAIQNIATDYASLNSDVRLRVNDLSLEWGGIFDINNNFQAPHIEHRIGRQADIGDKGINQDGDCVDIKQIIMFRLIRNHTDTRHVYHDNHYHIRVSN